MNSSSPQAVPDRSGVGAERTRGVLERTGELSERTRQGRFEELLAMGFERVDSAPETTESTRLDGGTFKLTEFRPAMGSFVTITALHRSQARAEHAVGTAFEEMDRLIGVFNRFEPSSPLSHLNESGCIDGAPAELVDVVEHGLRVGALTHGAFDMTVKPLVDLFRHPVTYAPRSRPPGPADVREALDLVGAGEVEIGRTRLRLKRNGMGLTLDGIAKGYIVDRLAEQLRRQDVTSFLINAGGDIRTGGRNGGGSPWTIAVRDPADPQPSWHPAPDSALAAPAVFGIMDGAVATSGSYEASFDHEASLDEALQTHHIFRPSDGSSPQRAVSVTVIAPTTLQADALATAVLVAGPTRGRQLIERAPGCECFVIHRDGDTTRTSGWPANSPTNDDSA